MRAFGDVVELLGCEEVFRKLVSELTNLVKILTLPASTCTAKMSIFRLRRLKTYLRSGMKQERLNSVAIMNLHKKKIKVLFIATLIDDFMCQTSVRRNTSLNQALT